MTPAITLEPVNQSDMPEFKRRLQDAFTQAAQEAFPDFPEVIPPERDIDESLAAEGAEALQMMCAGEPVGGAIVTGSGERMVLDFIFVDTAHQGKHVGYAAWQAIEARYPNTAHWELVTPYHEKRNIHFYVNRCGFKITEYYNEHHPDPNYPQEEAGDYPGEDGGMFKFEKGLALTDEELVAQFHAMWDGFPGLARLIDANHNVLAANPIACEKGFVEGAMCVKVGSPELHRKCKLNRFFEDRQPVTDHVLSDRVRGWMPIVGRDDVCVHFAVMIPEE